MQFDGLAWISNLLYLWRNIFPSLSHSLPIVYLWSRLSPKMRHHVKYLQTMNVCFILMVPIFFSDVTWPIHSILLPLADGSHIPVQGCHLLVLLNFSNPSSADNWYWGLCPKILRFCSCWLLCENELSVCHLCEFGMFLWDILVRNLSPLWFLVWVHLSQHIGIHFPSYY